VEFTELKKVEEKFKLGIRVYESSEDGSLPGGLSGSHHTMKP